MSDFGFGGLKGTRVPKPTPEEEAALDRVGEAHGFVSREAIPTVRRKRRIIDNEPTDQLNLRCSIRHINRFIAWCDEERITYRQGFQRLVDGIDK